MWEILNGKKTAIATAVLGVSAILSQVVVGIWEYSPDWMPKLVMTLDYVGMVIGSVGLGHKGVKTVKEG